MLFCVSLGPCPCYLIVFVAVVEVLMCNASYQRVIWVQKDVCERRRVCGCRGEAQVLPKYQHQYQLQGVKLLFSAVCLT